ncbi:MAG: UbiD family decarboxylase [Candidatus Lokiarchaeota archaeon]|nr:UbiD family decarboxylase [Candidatus Lokiarchaeota archaeon]MBD3201825.1 UbiD family decarboxylase [Candidatus Lokiarchaeota archaeon]
MRNFLEKIEVSEYNKRISINDLSEKIKETKEKPTLFKVDEFKFPIIAGLINDREKIAQALGTQKENIINYILKKLENIQEYSTEKSAGFLDNEYNVNANTDLDRLLPLIDFYAGKKYTTSSIVITRFPGEDRQNASFHRMMYLEKNKLAIRVVAQRHLDTAYVDAMDNNKDLGVAIIFGVHPTIELASAFSAPLLDELELAAAFLEKLKVYKLSNGISVPIDSEFVMLGRITSSLADEGPFIDLTGTADRIRKQPILKIDKLYHRNEPIFRTLLPGGLEHRMLMGIPQEPRIFKGVYNTISTVKNVVLTPGGCCWLHAIVQIKKRTEGDPSNAILATLAAHPSLKRVIVVDEDIDITNSNDVEWALATRFQPDKDLIQIPKSKGSSLDPSSDNSITCKYGLDATKPLNNYTEFEKVD